MNSSSIVRRIDDLGRVVIPKEIRRRIGVQEGDPMEIYLTEDRTGVIFKRYDPGLISDTNELETKIFQEYDDVMMYDDKEALKQAFITVRHLIKTYSRHK